MVTNLASFCLKVKNTFLEVGVNNNSLENTEGEDRWKRSESQPDWTTKKLLGSSFNFSRLHEVQEGKHSPQPDGSFCTESALEIEAVQEPEWEPEAELCGTILRQVTGDEDWPTWQQSQASVDSAEGSAIAKDTDGVSADEQATNVAGDDGKNVQKRTRRRRKRDSLIDKAAKQNRQPSDSNVSKSSHSTGPASEPTSSTKSSMRGTARTSCPHCAGQCQPSFTFCHFCGKKI
jgi:hypothetical protein